MTALKSSDAEVRRRAIFEIRDEILATSAESDTPLVSIIAESLDDPEGMVRRAAAVSLFDIGSRAASAREALINAAKAYPSADTGIFAIDALTNTGFASPEWGKFLLGYLDEAITMPAKVSALRALLMNAPHVDHGELTQRLDRILSIDEDPLVLEAAVSVWHELT